MERAYDVAAHWHKDQKRKSGDPYITHPLAVATILAELGMNTETICAALLHDTVEDTAYTLAELRSEFGEDVAALVDGVTKLDKVKYGDSAEAETVRKMVVAMSRDIRVLVIKLADRLHNMRTLRYMPRDKQERKSRETLEIYAPLAHRLGMNTVKWELEDLAFATLYPKRYDEIARLVSQRSPRRDQLLQEVIENLSGDMHEARIKGTVTGRPKHYYSIYQKMIARNVEFDDIYDLVGIRVLVDSVRDCYAALGTIHARWNPVPGRFKDYIAMPKFNMYQSLHTTVIGPGGKPVELQIRTWSMHKRAEYGVAAHWKYKEDMRAHGPVLASGNPAKAGSKAEVKASQDAAEMAWLRQLVDWQRETEDPAEFLDSLRFDLASAEVYVFTPRGEVIALPHGATPVDFAYAIHTDVGHRTIGARVNGRLVALESTLDNGDTVEIFTSKSQEAGPNRDWLNFVKSRPRPQQDPPVVLQGAPRGGGRGGQGPDRQGDAQAGPPAAAPDVRRDAQARSPPSCATPTSPACTPRSARAGSAPSRSSQAGPRGQRHGRRPGGPGRGHPDPAQGPQGRPVPLRQRLGHRGRGRGRRLGPPVQVLHPGPRRRDPGLRHPRPRRLRPPRQLRQPGAPVRHPARAHGPGPLGPERRVASSWSRSRSRPWTAPGCSPTSPGSCPTSTSTSSAPASRPPGTGWPSAASPSRWATPSTSATSCAPSAASTASTTSTASPIKSAHPERVQASPSRGTRHSRAGCASWLVTRSREE